MSLITECLDRLEDSIDVVYDIGANNGIWSEAFALYTDSQVFAFEPLPQMVNELEKRKQRCPKIEIQPFACGEKAYKTVINQEAYKVEASSILKMTKICETNFSASRLGKSREVEIQVFPLDEFVQRKQLPIPSLIKVDVQGYELKVFEGARETLAKTNYVWTELAVKQLYENGSMFFSAVSLLDSLHFELIDCVEMTRNRENDQLLQFDGIFRNKSLWRR